MMRKDKYPDMIKQRFRAYESGIVVFMAASLAEWIFLDVKYAPLLGVLFAAIIAVLDIRFRHKVDRVGYEWKRYHVIDHTYLTR